jgi:hypothetical protein
MFFLITSTNVLQMAQGNRPAHQRRKKVVDQLTILQDNQIRLMATLAQRDADLEKLQDNQIRLMATLAQRDADEEFRNLAAGKNNFVSSPVDSSYFYSCQVGIAFDPWPLEHESNSSDSVSSGSNTQGYIMDVPVRLQIFLLTSLE